MQKNQLIRWFGYKLDHKLLFGPPSIINYLCNYTFWSVRPMIITPDHLENLNYILDFRYLIQKVHSIFTLFAPKSVNWALYMVLFSMLWWWCYSLKTSQTASLKDAANIIKISHIFLIPKIVNFLNSYILLQKHKKL